MTPISSLLILSLCFFLILKGLIFSYFSFFMSDSMHLKLNLSKFNFIYLGPNLFLPLIMILDLTIYPSSTIFCLGFLLDSSFSLNSQIFSVASCYFHLRRIRQISPYLDDASLKILVCSLVLSRLDYCNSVL